VSWYVVDVEADGPYPPEYSMVCLGAVRLERALRTTIYVETRPISPHYQPEALAVSGFTRAEHERMGDPADGMTDFVRWIERTNRDGRPTFVSDNLAFDWQWINYYCWTFVGRNPFGWSGRRIGDLYAGLQRDAWVRWKHLRRTPHTHNPLDDARGNAEALLAMANMGLKLPIAGD
jgi:hypothetical protein